MFKGEKVNLVRWKMKTEGSLEGVSFKVSSGKKQSTVLRWEVENVLSGTAGAARDLGMSLEK